ncbi:hypothetical protein [Microbacterium pumilum]|uniref:Uncharacterized protein n=1 Tax=Microbacterium pumilum TaxID=344165 RepID=A0ABN2S2V1_9MICO
MNARSAAILLPAILAVAILSGATGVAAASAGSSPATSTTSTVGAVTGTGQAIDKAAASQGTTTLSLPKYRRR